MFTNTHLFSRHRHEGRLPVPGSRLPTPAAAAAASSVGVNAGDPSGKKRTKKLGYKKARCPNASLISFFLLFVICVFFFIVAIAFVAHIPKEGISLSSDKANEVATSSRQHHADKALLKNVVKSRNFLDLPKSKQPYTELMNLQTKTDYNDVLTFDAHVMENIRETYDGAKSFTNWEELPQSIDVSINDSQDYFQTLPLHATVDRRPIIVRKQLMEEKKRGMSLAASGKLLGCALTSATFVSNLEKLDVKHFEKDGSNNNSKQKNAPTCSVCFQFSNRQDMVNFVPSSGYEPLKPSKQYATKCFDGEANLQGRFAKWQQSDPQFRGLGFGYQWHVDCTLPSGVKELTCRKISRMQNEIDARDGLQKIYFKTKFELDTLLESKFSDDEDDQTSQKRRLRIETEWPWAALMSHDDDRSTIAGGLSMSWNDVHSNYVPSSYQKMTLAHVEGPGYDKTEYDGHLSLKSMNADKLSKGGVNTRFVSSLFHFIRIAPGSTHMIAVVDGQAQRSFKEVLNLLRMNVSDLFNVYGSRVFRNVTQYGSHDLIPISHMNSRIENGPFPLSMTLLELLRIRNIKIHMVPILTPSLVFEKSVCGGQYTFAPFLAARYAADFQVIMFVDGDTALVEGNNKQTLNEILYGRFFSENSSKCAGHRFRLIEQYVKPEYSNNDKKVLQCTEELARDQKKWHYAMDNCMLKEGHIVARTDSVYAFSVHHPDTLAGYLPDGVEDCITPFITPRYFLGEDEFVQLHLRDRERKAECSCFFEP